MRRGLWAPRLSVIVVLALLLSVGLPFGGTSTGAFPLRGSFPVSGLWRWLTPQLAYAAPSLPRLPGTPVERVDPQPPAGDPPAVPMGKGTQGDTPWTAPVLTGSSKYDPTTSVLIPAESTATTSVYRNTDGSKSVAVSTAPMNYQDAKGAWTPIDLTLVAGADGRLAPKAGPADVSFAPQAKDAVSVTSSDAAPTPAPTSTKGATPTPTTPTPTTPTRTAPTPTATATKGAAPPISAPPVGGSAGSGALSAAQTLGSVVLPGGNRVGFGLLGAATVDATVTGSQVRYQGVLPSQDLVLEPQTQGLKETIVLTSAAAGNEWTFPLDLGGLTARMADTGSVELVDPQGRVVGMIPAPFMQDSTFDPQTGDFVSSSAVKLQVVTDQGRPQLRVVADRAWLDDPARTYPVSIDPSVVFAPDGDAMADNDPSTSVAKQNGNDITLGTYNGGTYKSRSFVHFDLSALAGFYITGATAQFKLSWTYDCNHPTQMNIYQVTQSWTESSVSNSSYPGPSLGTLIGSGTPANNYPACQNSSGDRTVGNAFAVGLNPTVLNQWIAGSAANYGFGLVAANESDNYSWKRLTSKDFNGGVYGPRLFVDVVDAVPQLSWAYPTPYTQVASLTQRLSASATVSAPSGVSYRFRVYPGDHQQGDSESPIADSGTTSTAYYDVPAGDLTWGKQYVWSIQLSSATYTEPEVTFPFTTAVSGQVLTGSLAQNGGAGFAPDGRNYTTSATDAVVAGIGPALAIARSYNSLDPRADEAFGAGWITELDSRAVEETLDDGSPAVLVTYPTGEQVAFGRNADGTYSPPLGAFSTVTSVAGGGFTLTDKDGTSYTFTAGLGSGRWGLASVTDPQGRSLSFARGGGQVTTMTSASGRTLTLAWQTPAGASAAHVVSVTTPPATSGDPGSALVWTYAYTGDLLTSVCPPGTGTACTTYTYATSTRYPAAVLDTSPGSYWRLGEASGATVATSGVSANGGADNGTYVSTSVGAVAGPVSGAGASAPTFGSGSVVKLPRTAVVSSDHVSVALWFKTTGTGPLWGESNLSYGGSTAPNGLGTTPGPVAPPLYVGSDGKLRGAFPLAPTTMEIIGLASKCLDNWYGGTGDGNRIDLYTCNGGTTSQLWTWMPDGTLRIAGKCLDASGYGTGNGTLVQLWTCNDTANQIWLFKNGAAVNPVSGRCLDVPNSNTGDNAVQLELWDCNGGANQQWAGPAQPTPITTSGTVNDGQWHQVVLTAAGNTQAMYLDGAQVGTLAGTVRLPSTAISTVYSMIGGGYSSGTWPGQAGPGWQSFSGSIAEAAVYDRPLSSAEITGLRAAATGSASLLASVTQPAGDVSAQVQYVTADGTVKQVTDGSGGVWQVAAPTVAGSYQPYASAVLGDSPADYWRLADVYGTVPADQVTAQTTGTGAVLSGVTVNHDSGPFADPSGTGDQSKSATFAGNNTSYMQLPTGDNPQAGPSSISLWFRLAAGKSGVLYGTQNTPISLNATGYAPALYVGTDGKLRGGLWYSGMSPMTSSGRVDDNGWHHAVLTASSAHQTLYLDGQQIGTLGAGPTDYGVTNVYVGTGQWYSWAGSGPGDGRGWWPGQIAEISYYTHELTTPQVQAQFAAGQAGGGALARTIAVTSPTGGVAQTLQDIYGRLLAQVDARGYRTQYGYDSGYLHTITDPNGAVTTMGQDARGNTTSVTTCQGAHGVGCSTSYFTYYPDATTTQLTPDPRNDQLVDSRDARSASATDNTYLTHRAYDPATGNITDVTDPLGRHTTTTYTTGSTPAVGGGTTPPALPLAVTKPGGKVTTLGYDQWGDVVSITDAAGLVTTFTYDGLGRAVAKTIVSSTFPTGLTATTHYNAQGRVDWQQAPAALDRVTGATHTARTSFSYDLDGHELAQTTEDLTGGDSPRTTSFTYNSHGQGVTATTPGGKVTTTTYDAAGRVHTVTRPGGSTVRTDYDADGRVADTVFQGYTGDPNNPSAAADLTVETRQYDPAGQLIKIYDSQGYQTDYTYTLNGLLASTTRRQADAGPSYVESTNTYDAAGNLIAQVTDNGITTSNYLIDPGGRLTQSSTDPGGGAPLRKTAYTYNADDTVAQRQQYGGSTLLSTVSMTYDGMGRLLTSATTDPTLGALTTTLTRDEQGLVTSTTDPVGRTTYYSLDEAGRTVVTTAPATTAVTLGASPVSAHAVTYLGYDTFGEVVETKDADGNVTTTAYTADRHPSSVTAPAYTAPGTSTPITPVSTSTYDADGRTATVTDPLGRVTGYTYDQLGRLAKITDPAGHTITYTYDLNGNATSVTDQTGARQEAQYDYLGRVTLARQDVRQTSSTYDTTTTYTTGGWPATVTTPTGVSTTTTYDNLGEPLTVTQNGATVASYSYDGLGRLVTTTLPDLTSTTLAYNVLGEVTSQIDADAGGNPLRSTTQAYDLAGNLISATDALGHTTTYAYDATNLPTSKTVPVDSSNSITTDVAYDLAGNPTRSTSGNGNVSWATYNPLGLVESQVEPTTTAYAAGADGTSTVSYDAAGEPTTIIAPGGVSTTTSYSGLGLVVAEAGSGAEATTTTRTFGYDNAGRLVTFSGPGGTNSLAYDDRGLLLATSGGSGTASFSYNGDGNLVQRTDAAGTTTYGYDARQRLNGVTAGSALISGISYNALSQPTTITYGGGKTRTLGYDALHRLTSDELKSGSTSIAEITYGWDANDDEVAKTVAGFGSSTVANTYTYDYDDRLTSWDDGTTPVVYAYDDDGNRLQAGPTLFTYDERDEPLTATNTSTGGITSYSYSARGTLTSTATTGVGTWTTTADAFGQIITQGAAGGSTQSYDYDALGRLVRSGAPYSGVGPTLAADGSDTYTYTPAGGVVAVQDPAGTRLEWTDRHTDVVAQFAANSGTSLAATTTYDPYGTVVGSTSSMLGTLGYQSEYADPATGQVNMGSRWYNPATGAFDTRDSVSTPNRFAYADANPLGETDPSGHCFIVCVSTVTSAVSSGYHATVGAAVTAGSFLYTTAKTTVNTVASVTGTSGLLNAIENSSLVQNLKNTLVNSSLGQYVKNNYSSQIAAGQKAANAVTSAVSNAVNDAKNKIQQQLQQDWNTLKSGATTVWEDASTFVEEHKADIAGFATGLVVGIGCTLATGGAGALGCAVLAGAAASFVTGAMKGQTGLALLETTAIGALSGLVFAGAGELAGPLISDIGGSLVRAIVGNAARDGLEDLAGEAGGALASDLADTAASDLADSLGADAADLADGLGADAGDLGGEAGDIGAPGEDVAPTPSERPGSPAADEPSAPKPGEAKPAEEPEPPAGEKPCSCGCKDSFAPTTPVLLADGSTKAIKDVTIGDPVITTDPATGATQAEPVTMLHLNHDTNLVDITVATANPLPGGDGTGEGDGDRSTRGPTTVTIHTTTEHPFWDTTTSTWIAAADLVPGQSSLRELDGTTVAVTAVTPVAGAANMYNLTVADIHTYYVLAGNAPVLVHNCDDFIGPKDHVALGREGNGLKDFASQVDARVIRSGDWQQQVQDAVARVGRGEGDISVMIDGLPGANRGVAGVMQEARAAVARGKGHYLATQWEMVQIDDAGILDRVSFFRFNRKQDLWQEL